MELMELMAKMVARLNQLYSDEKTKYPGRTPNFPALMAEVVRGEGFHEQEAFTHMLQKLSEAHTKNRKNKNADKKTRFAKSWRQKAS